jgi:hypothetical protein
MKAASIHERSHRARAAFTLVELLITASLVVIVGGLVFVSLHAGVHLFGKNVAINLPYQSSRAAFDLLQRDLHGSIAEPRLIDASLASVSGPGPAAGVALRYHVGGPCVVAADAAAASPFLEVRQIAGFTPQVGDLVSLPAFRIERNVTAVTSSGSLWQFTLDAPLGAALIGTAGANFVTFFSRRCGYVVAGTNLLRYPDLTQPGSARVISRGVTNPTPFSFPLLAGQPDRRYLAAALTVAEPSTSAQQWKAANANLIFTIAYRATSALATQ